MEHQAKRKAKMAEHLQESCLRLEALRRDVAQLQQQLHDRRKAKVNFTITVSGPHKIAQFIGKIVTSIISVTVKCCDTYFRACQQENDGNIDPQPCCFAISSLRTWKRSAKKLKHCKKIRTCSYLKSKVPVRTDIVSTDLKIRASSVRTGLCTVSEYCMLRCHQCCVSLSFVATVQLGVMDVPRPSENNFYRDIASGQQVSVTQQQQSLAKRECAFYVRARKTHYVLPLKS